VTCLLSLHGIGMDPLDLQIVALVALSGRVIHILLLV
jgi:hypothetical protein